ncbi:MAG: tetratricopeptide repeat protein [Saprospiraceae bacterium]|nr:tetratricopeptide repeat protein [Saprospiraceae bacterium]
MLNKLLLTWMFFTFSVSIMAQLGEIDSLVNCFRQAESDSAKAFYAVELSAKTYRTDTEMAREWGEKSIQFARRANNSLLEATSLSTLGVVYYYQGDLEKTLTYYFQSLAIAEKEGHQISASTTLGNIGLLYAEQEDFSKALAYLYRSLDAKIRLNDSIGIARNYANIGMVYSHRMLPDSAIIFYEKQVQLCDQLHEVYGMGIGLNNIGQVYMEKGRYDQALDYFQKALAIKASIQDKNGMSVTLGNIGETYLKQKRNKEAIPPLMQSLQLAEESKSLPKMEMPYLLLTQAYAGLGNFKEAYHYQSLLLSVRDSLGNKERLDRAEELEAKYQHELQQAELTRQELTIISQRQVKNRIVTSALALLLLLGGLFYRMRTKQRTRQKEIELMAQIEHAEAEKLRELDAMKSAFLTNISHEFRTPLTLIISPLEQLLRGTLKGNLSNYYQAMLRNGRRLLDLVNQMLELSKLEEGKLTLAVSPGDLQKFVLAIGGSFESLAEQKQIRYDIAMNEADMTCYFDPDKVEKILVNLLSNAFKYTEDGGHIRLELSLDQSHAHLNIADSGVGIPEELQPRLFNRFFLTTQSDIQAGSGLGLALTKELVELHHGQIRFESEPGNGSQFYVRFPILESAYLPGEIHMTKSDEQLGYDGSIAGRGLDEGPGLSRALSMDQFAASHRPQLLIVEDNPEVRQYLTDQLKGVFAVLEAADGRSGLAIAEEKLPDLIISDVMMPVMSGTELCERIKSNERTCHIPVILLTAKAEQSDKLEGLDKGADDYIIKPFDAEELRIRAVNMIEQRARLQEFYRRSLHVFSQEHEPVKSLDGEFLERVRFEILAQLGNEQFSVVDLSQQVGMSRSQLHRKLTAMTGYSPNQVIRLMRLEKARHLVQQRWGTVSEIAYDCGFSSPAYFIKCYKELFGQTPGEDA